MFQLMTREGMEREILSESNRYFAHQALNRVATFDELLAHYLAFNEVVMVAEFFVEEGGDQVLPLTG